MEEKVLITSERYNIKKALKIVLIVGAVISAVVLLSVLGYNMKKDGDLYDYCYEEYYEEYLQHQKAGHCGWGYKPGYQCHGCNFIEENPDKFEYVFGIAARNSNTYLLCLLPFAVFALVGGLLYLWLRSYELIVTDKRVYGRVAFGKRVDLPVDSISSTATIRLFKGISVATSSGKISFLVIKNADEIYGIVNKILIERQKEKAKEVAPVTIAQSDEADQLRKYKDLLDSGVITQEEFDAKKKQLLGL